LFTIGQILASPHLSRPYQFVSLENIPTGLDPPAPFSDAAQSAALDMSGEGQGSALEEPAVRDESMSPKDFGVPMSELQTGGMTTLSSTSASSPPLIVYVTRRRDGRFEELFELSLATRVESASPDAGVGSADNYVFKSPATSSVCNQGKRMRGASLGPNPFGWGSIVRPRVSALAFLLALTEAIRESTGEVIPPEKLAVALMVLPPPPRPGKPTDMVERPDFSRLLPRSDAEDVSTDPSLQSEDGVTQPLKDPTATAGKLGETDYNAQESRQWRLLPTHLVHTRPPAKAKPKSAWDVSDDDEDDQMVGTEGNVQVSPSTLNEKKRPNDGDCENSESRLRNINIMDPEFGVSSGGGFLFLFSLPCPFFFILLGRRAILWQM
jgi:hypothetical protein